MQIKRQNSASSLGAVRDAADIEDSRSKFY